jgi:alpha-beta hydrolase superfamily lysophospholipase
MNEYPLTLSAADGHPITGTLYAPPVPTAVLVISHGMAEHGGRYAELARWLAARGLAVITYHHRGHDPDGPARDLGHYADRDGWRKVLADLGQVITEARARVPGRPVNLLGHSMGSFIAQGYAQAHGETVDTLILSATNRIHRPQLRAALALLGVLRRLRGQRHRSRLIQRLTFGQFNRRFRPNRTEADWLSRDPAQVDRYLADPACGFACSVGLWQDFLAGMLTLAPVRWRRDLPVHLFSGTADPVGEMGRGIRRHFQAIREAGIERVTLRLFDGGRHEMLNEIHRDEVWSYLLSLCRTLPQTTDTAMLEPTL